MNATAVIADDEDLPRAELRRMLAATTAIVIGGRVRPSFYWSATGAIYLDASYLWLTPEQFTVLPVSDKFVEYAYQVKQQLEADDLRGSVDDRNETIGRKIRDNELKRIPFLLVVGEKEQEAGTISVRKQGEGDQGAMTINAFADLVKTML